MFIFDLTIAFLSFFKIIYYFNNPFNPSSLTWFHKDLSCPSLCFFYIILSPFLFPAYTRFAQRIYGMEYWNVFPFTCVLTCIHTKTVFFSLAGTIKQWTVWPTDFTLGTKVQNSKAHFMILVIKGKRRQRLRSKILKTKQWIISLMLFKQQTSYYVSMFLNCNSYTPKHIFTHIGIQTCPIR